MAATVTSGHPRPVAQPAVTSGLTSGSRPPGLLRVMAQHISLGGHHRVRHAAASDDLSPLVDGQRLDRCGAHVHADGDCVRVRAYESDTRVMITSLWQVGLTEEVEHLRQLRGGGGSMKATWGPLGHPGFGRHLRSPPAGRSRCAPPAVTFPVSAWSPGAGSRRETSTRTPCDLDGHTTW